MGWIGVWLGAVRWSEVGQDQIAGLGSAGQCSGHWRKHKAQKASSNPTLCSLPAPKPRKLCRHDSQCLQFDKVADAAGNLLQEVDVLQSTRGGGRAHRRVRGNVYVHI